MTRANLLLRQAHSSAGGEFMERRQREIGRFPELERVRTRRVVARSDHKHCKSAFILVKVVSKGGKGQTTVEPRRLL
jgi:hypothetical protein